MRRLILLLLFAGYHCGFECRADTVSIATRNDGQVSYATGCCVGHVGGRSIVATAWHVVHEPGIEVAIYQGGRWHSASVGKLNESLDIATIECDVPLNAVPMESDVSDGSRVLIQGSGSHFHKSGEPLYFRGRCSTVDEATGEIEGDGGLAAISGDSGGPVLTSVNGETVLVGIAVGVWQQDEHGVRTPTEYEYRRTAYSRYRQKVRTLYTRSGVLGTWLETQYDCRSGQCFIRPRYQVQQPGIGVMIPTGPPSVVQVRPVQQPAPRPQPSQQCNCPDLRPYVRQWLEENKDELKGRDGNQGPVGETGPSVKQKDVEAAVTAYLQSNMQDMLTVIVADYLRQNPDGFKGEEGKSATAAQINAAVASWMAANQGALKGTDGKPWTVNVRLRWANESEPFASLPVSPPKLGSSMTVDVPLLRESFQK